MAPCANWKGFVRLSRVTCPVAPYPATSNSAKISCSKINGNTGHRIRYLRLDAEPGEQVANKDMDEGGEVGTDSDIKPAKEEAESIAPQSTRTIATDEFAQRQHIDPHRLSVPYRSRAGRRRGARRNAASLGLN